MLSKLIASGVAFLLIASVAADTIHVPGDYPTIQEAIFACQDGDTVLVADGVYTGAYNKNIDFGGLAITVRSENGPEKCIIDCENDGRGFQFRFGEQSDSVVDGFTITNGTASLGGAIHCQNNSAPTFRRCVITGNSAGHGGGAYFSGSNGVSLSSCVISGNSAVNAGGGLYFNQCHDATIEDCEISNNAVPYYQGEGGGVGYYDCTGFVLRRCAITENRVSGDWTKGGGVFVKLSSGTIVGCTISANISEHVGGGLHCHDVGSLEVIDSTFAANWANNDYYGNGGAILCGIDVNLNITGCTFSQNRADRRGGAVSAGTRCVLTVRDSVLWQDIADEGGEVALFGATLTVSYSDVEGGWAWVYIEGGTLNWAEGNIVADPIFADPDGPDDDPNTWEDNDFHLTADSPCIDVGDPDFVPEPDERDIDGEMRVWDGDDDGLWIVDMGSDEYGSMVPGDLDGDGCVGQSDLGILLASWGIDDGGDLDFDGDTDQSDLGILLAHWGEGCP